ncbi:MAG: NTP transferase domain-containing protein [Lachnospiraceae bacterium]|nr:NTP transferase domain-containing protein [Lachnospiraceae bacterium]
MNFDYIIIQCGGLGTRLRPYTNNRPKALVPFKNKPLISHMFAKYPDKRFIIIADYKYEVLEKYLENFADIPYIPIHITEKGNIAGIKKALTYIPNDKGIMIIWSDVVLGNGFKPEVLPNDSNYVGITDRFTCSWSSVEGKLDKVTVPGKGVSGCFIFKNKQELSTIPDSGSLTLWMRDNDIRYSDMDMADSIEIGTVDALKSADTKDNRCRPYNRITIDGDTVIKEGITKEGESLLIREREWYSALSDAGFAGIPKIFQMSPLKMQRIHGDNIFKASIPEDCKQSVLSNMVGRLKELHSLSPSSPDCFDMEKDYYRKTVKRLASIRNCLPFSDDEFITINGKKCRNVFKCPELFKRSAENIFSSAPTFGIIHGDCTFTNTLIDDNENIYFIDARGYFGDTSLVGDPDYDWAKIYYSIVGAFDQFNIGKFRLDISDTDVTYKIESSGWEAYEDHFWKLIPEADPYRVRFIHAIVWLSLASHCYEDYDSMCLAYYNGLYLWNELIEENEDLCRN